MKSKLTLFVAIFAAALFGGGCASVKITKEQLQSGLIAYYPFNGNTMDASGNGNHGEVLDGAKLTVDRHGAENRAYSFDGVDDHIHVKDSKRIEPLHGFTVSIWYYNLESREDAWAGLIAKGGPGQAAGLRFWTQVSRKIFLTVYGKNGRLNSDLNPDSHSGKLLLIDNKWTQLVFTFDGEKKWSFYQNGTFVETLEKAIRVFWSPPQYNINWRIGMAHRSYFEGKLDDIRIYDRDLSDDEVKALYNLEKPKGK